MKRLLQRAFHKTGALTAVNRLRPSGLRILVYHKFAGPHARGALARQCAYLRRNYQPISLSTVAEHLAAHRPFPRRAIAVTVDDGYRDFYDVAFPVFREWGIPVTVFVTTGFLDRECWLWVDQVRYLFEHSTVSHADLTELSIPRSFRLDTPEERATSIAEVKAVAKRLPNAQRIRLIAELQFALATSLPPDPPHEVAPLSWDQVRAMRAIGMEFGAHTVTHPILSSLSDSCEVRSEMERSKARIEEELGAPVLHFAYPNGKSEDIPNSALEHAPALGFRTAVTTRCGRVTAHDDPFTLKRIVVEPELPEFWFEELIELFRLRAKGVQC